MSTRLQPPEIPKGDARHQDPCRREILAALARQQRSDASDRLPLPKVDARWHAWLLIRDGEPEPDWQGRLTSTYPRGYLN